MSNWSLSNWSLPILLLLTAAAYLNSFAGSWQFDDFAVLLRDPRVQSLAAWWQSLPHIRPLFKLSVALNHQLGGSLLLFHLLNLLLHLINTVLVYALCRRLLRNFLNAEALTLSTIFITLIFALHPAQTEVVTYLSGRSVALEATGVLLAVWSWLHVIEQPSWRWRAVTLIAVLLAVASRETAIVTPLLLCWFSFMVRTSAPTAVGVALDSRPAAGRFSVVIAVLLMLVLLALLLLLPRYRELIGLALQWQNLSQLLASQTQALLHLLLVALGWAPLNADPALMIAELDSVRGAMSVVVIAALCWLGWYCRARQPLVALGIGWAMLSWLPTHSLLLRYDPVNDRQLYLALPGLSLALVAGLAAMLKWLRERATLTSASWRQVVPMIVLLLFALLLARQIWQRNQLYRAEIPFWQDVVQKAPHNARGWNNLGVALADADERVASERAFEQALAIRPGYVQAAVNLKLLRAGLPLQAPASE
ncbi:hypothetical protein HPT27_04035 [Permianibacter sp. IMCC34836]|uniref:hypothetical protein n=1 Tax=Permianibacter fluminis TaxID=2738515 RepID=UPI0015557C3F|nr:hypothetical protein [Permianibacter fluminis]NQD36182.1 hypothetical protein [Permianibacter fluminis]